jgi:hypothetical protein
MPSSRISLGASAMRKNNINEIIHRGRKPLTEKDFVLGGEQLIEELRMVSTFVDTDEVSRDERTSRGRTDPFFFYNTYFPHVFKDERADWHPEFVNDLQRTDEMLAVTAQRGGAKSAILFAEVIRWICYRQHRLIIYRLDSLDKAEYYTQRILIEFQHNQRLKHDFGELVSSNAARADFVCFDPETKRTISRVVAFGANQSLRGFINEDTRPDVIISEDLQDRESAESEKRTEKELRRLLRDARPALTPTGWKFIVIGNIICSGSLMDILLDEKKYKTFIKRRYPAEYRNQFGIRVSTWNARFPIQLLNKVKEDIGDDAYEVEYLCKAVEVGTVFKAKRDIHRYRELPLELDLHGVVLIQVDPALSGTNDYTAIGVFISYTHDINRPDYNRWADEDGTPFGEGIYTICLEVFCRQVGIDDTIEACYELFNRWNASDFHCDGSVDKEIVFERFFSQHEVRTGERLPIVFDKFLVSKDARIKALQPLMQRKRVLLPPGNSEDTLNVIKQLTRYGKTNEHDDAPDMIAAAVENLDPQYGSGRTEVYII